MSYFIYTLTLSMGAYLLLRRLYPAALGLIIYAVGIAVDTFSPEITLRYIVTSLAACLWVIAVLDFLPERNKRLMLFAVAGLSLGLIGHALGWYLLEVAPLIPLAAAFIIVIRTRPQQNILLAATIFFGLGVGGLILLREDTFSGLILLAIGVDLLALGYAIAAMDAYDQGEAFWAELLQYMLLVLITAGVFGVQIAIVMQIQDVDLSVLLFGILTAAVMLVALYEPVRTLLDYVTLRDSLRSQRTQTRAVANAIPRINPQQIIDAEAFARLTRRALSNLGDLSKLASSPLAQHEHISGYLKDNHLSDNAIERANALKAILTDAILRLKPQTNEDFGTTDEWRHFNVLYYPYVRGLKPYSRRASYDDLREDERAALDWMRTYVPERTLYNWQNAAARLIAEALAANGSR